MQLFLKDAAGASKVVDATADTTVADLKAEMPMDCHFTHAGKVLSDDTKILALGEAATLEVCFDMLGAGKKRKKKQYTKPKKIKGKHKKVKLAVLKFYKVDGSDKVQRLRKECPNCGKGVFMAMHSDRYYCGRCTLTYVFKKEDEQK